jgi:hypothetical protein
VTVKEIYSPGDKMCPDLLGMPTTDVIGTDTRYVNNLAIDAAVGVNMQSNIGVAFSTKVGLDKTIVSGAGVQKTTIWFPPSRFILSALALKVWMLEVTTTGGTVPPTLQFGVGFGKADLTSSIASNLCGGDVSGADPKWVAATPPSSFMWGFVADTGQNGWVNTYTTPVAMMGLSGNGNSGYLFDGTVKDGAGVTHDRFYFEIASVGGTPGGMTTRYVIDVLFTGFLVG